MKGSTLIKLAIGGVVVIALLGGYGLWRWGQQGQA